MLSIKEDFEGALLQRAKIKSRNADWQGARADFEKAKKHESPDLVQLEEAQGAAILAAEAEKKGDWEACVGHSGTAILVASTALGLRKTRAHCRFERGEVLEGVSDLQHCVQISPSDIDPHLQISAQLFYSVGDTDKGIEQMRRCLRSDPDSKACSRLFRRQKQLDKTLKKIKELESKRQFNSAVKLLIGSGEDQGLIKDIKEDMEEARTSGTMHPNSSHDLYASLEEMTCHFYNEVSSLPPIYPFTIVSPRSPLSPLV